MSSKINIRKEQRFQPDSEEEYEVLKEQPIKRRVRKGEEVISSALLHKKPPIMHLLPKPLTTEDGPYFFTVSSEISCIFVGEREPAPMQMFYLQVSLGDLIPQDVINNMIVSGITSINVTHDNTSGLLLPANVDGVISTDLYSLSWNDDTILYNTYLRADQTSDINTDISYVVPLNEGSAQYWLLYIILTADELQKNGISCEAKYKFNHVFNITYFVPDPNQKGFLARTAEYYGPKMAMDKKEDKKVNASFKKLSIKY